MPFRKLLFVCCLVVLIGRAATCQSPVNRIYVQVSKSTGTRVEAMGAECDPHFFSQNLTRSDGAEPADWRIVIGRVRAMKLKKFRIMVLPQWYEPRNDNADPMATDLNKFTFDSPEMRSLYKVLDLAQARHMDVCLVLWGCPVRVSLLDPRYKNVSTCFMANPDKKNVWITGPNNYQEWAENFSALIRHLVVDRKYACVREITPVNEPDGGPVLAAPEYVKMVKILDARFRRDGIRDKVRFDLSDNTDTRTSFLAVSSDSLSREADVFNSHTYIFGYDTPNEKILDWERTNVSIAARAHKKHLVGEFGSNQTAGASRQRDIDRYERGVLVARLVLNFFNAGASGVSYWSLFDQYYGRDDSYGQMQQLGLWRYVKTAYRSDTTFDKIHRDYQVRPQYYSYSLLTRFIKPGAEVYPLRLNNDFAAGTAFKEKNGKWTYVFANQTDSTLKLSVACRGGGRKNFDVYRYEKDRLPAGDEMIPSRQRLRSMRDGLELDIHPHSVVLCRQQ